MNHSRGQMSNHVSHDTHDHHHHSNALPDRPMSNTVRHNDHHSMMKMYFHAGFIETILFEQWTTTSRSLFISSWIFIFILGMLYEGIREVRQCLEEGRTIQKPISVSDNENELELMNIESPGSNIKVKKKITPRHAERTLNSILYTVQLALSYILMLIAMTFNIYFFFAIIFGIGMGYLVFGWSRRIPSIDKNQRHT